MSIEAMPLQPSCTSHSSPRVYISSWCYISRFPSQLSSYDSQINGKCFRTKRKNSPKRKASHHAPADAGSTQTEIIILHVCIYFLFLIFCRASTNCDAYCLREQKAACYVGKERHITYIKSNDILLLKQSSSLSRYSAPFRSFFLCLNHTDTQRCDGM